MPLNCFGKSKLDSFSKSQLDARGWMRNLPFTCVSTRKNCQLLGYVEMASTPVPGFEFPAHYFIGPPIARRPSFNTSVGSSPPKTYKRWDCVGGNAQWFVPNGPAVSTGYGEIDEAGTQLSTPQVTASGVTFDGYYWVEGDTGADTAFTAAFTDNLIIADFTHASIEFVDGDRYFHGAWSLSNEYTEAMAIANPRSTVIGSLSEAKYEARTSGYTFYTVDVTFTIHCKHLTVGQDYRVEVQFIDQDNTKTITDYDFTADADTHDVVEDIPTQTRGHSLRIKRARVFRR